MRKKHKPIFPSLFEPPTETPIRVEEAQPVAYENEAGKQHKKIWEEGLPLFTAAKSKPTNPLPPIFSDFQLCTFVPSKQVFYTRQSLIEDGQGQLLETEGASNVEGQTLYLLEDKAVKSIFSENNIQEIWLSPFQKAFVYAEEQLNQATQQEAVLKIGLGKDDFSVCLSRTKTLHAGSQACFELSFAEGDKAETLSDEAVAHFRKHYKNLRPRLEKKDIFNYAVAVLFSPAYKRTFLPFISQAREFRIPFYGDFWKMAGKGRKIARLFLEWESLDPYPLHIQNRQILPESSELESGLPEELEAPKPQLKMRTNKTKGVCWIDSELSLHEIPFEKCGLFVPDFLHHLKGLLAQSGQLTYRECRKNEVEKLQKLISLELELQFLLES